VQVSPEHRACDGGAGVQHVMVVVPIDSDVEEAQDVGEKDRQQGAEVLEAVTMGNFQLQHHDGDDDGDDTVAEGFQASFWHVVGNGIVGIRVQKAIIANCLTGDGAAAPGVCPADGLRREFLQEAIKEGQLTIEDTLAGLVEREPGSAIHFRDFHGAA